MSSDNDDLMRRLMQLKGVEGGFEDTKSSDAALSDRFSKLTGNSFVALQSSSSSSNRPSIREKVLCEDDLIDDILEQAAHEAVLEAKTSHRLESPLEDRLARLKGISTVTEPVSASTSKLSPSDAIEGQTVTLQKSERTPLELDWMSDEEDENDDDVLNKVIASALLYSEEEEEQ